MHGGGADCWCICITLPSPLGFWCHQWVAPGHRAPHTVHLLCPGCWSFLPQASVSLCVISQCRHVQPASSLLVLSGSSPSLSHVFCPAEASPEASFDNPKDAVKCHPSLSLSWLLEAGTFPRALGFGKQSVPSELWTTPSPWLPCQALFFTVPPVLGGTAMASTILVSARAVSGLPVATLSSMKADPSLVTQRPGPRERAHSSPERTRQEARVPPLD